ncbi:MAG: hypothetical protein LBF12_04180 [Christensenellaceae bacterium]|nr:hypothetical protein [Christensenellaceae bacterium]
MDKVVFVDCNTEYIWVVYNCHGKKFQFTTKELSETALKNSSSYSFYLQVDIIKLR